MSTQDPNPPPDAGQPPSREPVRHLDSPVVKAGLYFLGLLVLAYFIVPLFLSPMVGTPVSRTRSDLRTLVAGIESYFTEHLAYPLWTTSAAEAAVGRDPSPIDLLRFPTFRAFADGGHSTITTSLDHMIKNGLDELAPAELTPYRYVSLGSRWIVWSAGPNRRYEIDLDATRRILSVPHPADELIHLTYDPSNGNKSAGDVWRVKP